MRRRARTDLLRSFDVDPSRRKAVASTPTVHVESLPDARGAAAPRIGESRRSETSGRWARPPPAAYRARIAPSTMRAVDNVFARLKPRATAMPGARDGFLRRSNAR